jgi:AcrR family transcriptional regulator
MDSTRSRILSIGLSAFAARGYSGAGIQELCEGAAITKPTLYYYFGSKRGLLEAIATERYAPFVHSVAADGVYRSDIAGALVSVMDCFLGSARRDPDFARLRLSLAFSPPASEEHAVFRPFTEKLYTVMRSFFSAAAEDHGNIRGRELAYSASFIGTADAYTGLLLAGAMDPDTAVVRRIVHFFMHGIFS